MGGCSFANLRELRVEAIQSFGEAIRNGSFPDPVNESYKTEKTEWDRFLGSYMETRNSFR